MKPLIKLRLLKIKNEPCQNGCLLSVPIIMALFLLLYYDLFTRNILGPSGLKPQTFSPIISDIFSTSSIRNITAFTTTNVRIAIVSNNKSLSSSFKTFSETYYCINGTNCKTEEHASMQSIESEINSPDYFLATEYVEIIEIESISQSGGIHFKYKSSFLSYKSLNQEVNKLPFNTTLTRKGAPEHNAEIFQNFQVLTSNFILHYIGKAETKPSFEIQAQPISTRAISGLQVDSQFILVFVSYISLSYIYFQHFIVVWMVTEKEKKQDAFLYGQGVSKRTYHFSWMLSFVMITILPTLISSVIIIIKFLPHSNVLLFFVSQTLCLMSTFSLCFFAQSFLDKIETANSVIKVLMFSFMALVYSAISADIPAWIKIIISLFPQINQMFNLVCFILLNEYQFSSWTLITTPHNGISLLVTVIMYMISTVMWFVLGFAVTSYRQNGQLFGKKVAQQENSVGVDGGLINENEKGESNLISNSNSNNSKQHQVLSSINEQLKENGNYLAIKNITKCYNDLKAVNCFNGELFPNEIFCLLGHNGAGKTTLIRIISGNENADYGDVCLYNVSLITDKKYLYNNIGLCSQENIFFEYLTVTEHLQIMAELRGSASNINDINTLLSKIDLTAKKDAKCQTLSGGQKRKLCIALALIGDHKLVLLDEPTSGMDVIAKRELWEFLKEYKQNKIIILTTHSLEEAEYLGDRIGIMSEGRFVCSGTSSYLKDLYPCGYNVNFVFDANEFTDNMKYEFYGKLKAVDGSAVIKVMSKFVFSVNFSTIEQNVIQSVFSEIEKNKQQYRIKNYTVSSTKLEDVFIKLNSNELSKAMFDDLFTSNNNNDNNNNRHAINNIDDNNQLEILTTNIDSIGLLNNNNANNNNTDCNKLFHEFKENLNRHFLTLWRNKKIFLLEVFNAFSMLFLFIIVFLPSLQIQEDTYLDINYLLKHNELKYIFPPSSPITIDTLKHSYFYSAFNIANDDITFTELSTYNITAFTNNVSLFNSYYIANDKYQNDKSLISFNINPDKDNTYTLLHLYQAESQTYYQAVTNLFLSAFFEKHFGIHVSFGHEYACVPLGTRQTIAKQVKMTVIVMIALLMTIFAFMNVSTYMLTAPLKDRLKNIKQLLFLSGASVLSYWSAYVVVDLFKYGVIVIFMVVFFGILNVSYLYLIPILVCFIIGINIFTYCMSFVFDKEETGPGFFMIILMFIFIAIPINLAIVIYNAGSEEFLVNPEHFFIMLLDVLTPLSTLFIAEIRIGMMTLTQIIQNMTSYQMCCLIWNHCSLLIINWFIWGFVLYLIEKGVFRSAWNSLITKMCFSNESKLTFGTTENEQEQFEQVIQAQKKCGLCNKATKDMVIPVVLDRNDYVIKEINKIEQNKQLNMFAITIKNLTKTFCVCCNRNIRAVNHLYLGIEQNERFGLLGYNGSGKTTTFKCITNELTYDTGEIKIFGYNASKDIEMLRKNIGYCPQEDALFDYFTVNEILLFYKKLKGVASGVDLIAKRFGLEKYLNTYCVHLSGGNKRKLAFAIALMNDPELLLLDEPSTGVDPESRRVMWKNINLAFKRENQFHNMILSTHSMEEAEILCDTVSWLRHGNFTCVGNPEQLKMNASTGYNLHVKFKGNGERFSNVDVNESVEEFKRVINNTSDEVIDSAVKDNESVVEYFKYVVNFIQKIKQMCSSIKLNEIRKDYSFEFSIAIIEERQSDLFVTIFSEKTLNASVSEMSIDMESLESILVK